MESKEELLRKLGFSEDYLQLLEDNSQQVAFDKMEDSFYCMENQIVDIKMTSLIIEKTEKPINNHFIFNER